MFAYVSHGPPPPLFHRRGSSSRKRPAAGEDQQARIQACGHSTKQKRRIRHLLSDNQRHYLVESWDDIVVNVPGADATVDDVRVWLTMVLHRRSHPDPDRIMNKLRWTGRDLHRATYLSTRHCLSGEADGMMIAHNIRDAVKESRKRAKLKKKGLESGTLATKLDVWRRKTISRSSRSSEKQAARRSLEEDML